MQRMKQITIIGTGLLGTSLALAIKQRNLADDVVGAGRTQSTLDRAKASGGFDQVTTDYAAALAKADMVVIALPLGCFDEAFEKIREFAPAKAMITDVGSTKQSVLASARTVLGEQGAVRFVGSHPMAGSEMAGPDAARGDLFEGKPCVVTVETDTDPKIAAAVQELWISVGMNVLLMEPEQHDRFVAAVSHVPHLAAGLLVALTQKQGGLDIASTGFSSATRLASGSPTIWKDIVTTNREPIVAALRAFGNDALALADLVEQGDGVAIAHWLEEQKKARDSWVSKQNR